MRTTHETLQQSLSDLFAPWVQALNLQVERFDADSVTLRLPQSAGCCGWGWQGAAWAADPRWPGLQAMATAMKASRKISNAPAAGMTTGMCLTTFSTGSSDVCMSLWADMMDLKTRMPVL